MRKFVPHFIAVGIFITISAIYFSPVLTERKVLSAHDVDTWKGMSKEVRDFRSETGEEALWTKRMFSGMPAYQISTKSNGNLLQYIDKVIQLGLPRPMNLLFMYLIGFYILLLTLKIDYRLAIVGAIGFAFSSYFIIIIQAGHMTKAHAIAYLPLIIASVLYVFNKQKWFLGSVFTALFVGLQLYSNHYQITYYTIIILFFIGIVQFVKELQDKTLPNFFKKAGILVVAALLGGATNYTRLATTMEYGPETQRGKSELVTDDGKAKNDGLDASYILRYSYGKAETMTFLIPNFNGGIIGRSVLQDEEGKTNKDSKTLKFLSKVRDPNKQNQLQQKTLAYWGDYDPAKNKIGPGSPTYVGAIICFLFVLGLLIVKTHYKYWILLSTILSIFLGWGYNFYGFSEFFIDFFPGYNKFRAVTMVMIIAEFGIALLAILALNKFLKKEEKKKKEQKLKLAFYITGGVTLIFALFPSIFVDFISDTELLNNSKFIDALVSDRETIMKSDALRSFIFILLSASMLWMFIKGKIKKQYVVLAIGFLILTDMWSVDKRYLNETHFVRKSRSSFVKTEADNSILSHNKDHSRVFNLNNPFNESATSYYHNSIGGYHAAKLLRYQELIDNQLSPERQRIINNYPIQRYNQLQTALKKLPDPNGDVKIEQENVIRKNQINSEINKIQDSWNFSNVLNMLNTKYIIYNPKAGPIINQDALGNAWFVSEIKMVENANQEMESLNIFNPATTAIVDKRFLNKIIGFSKNKSDSIWLDQSSYNPNHLTYILKNTISDKLAVFSEIYYDKGWNAYIDGRLVPHFRANYVLRAMMVPAGTAKIEFKFEPSSFHTGETVAYASSIILLLLLVFVSYKEFK